MAGSQQDVDATFKAFDDTANKVKDDIQSKVENIIATFVACLDDITGIDGWLATNGACRLLTKVNEVTADTSYTITNTDNYLEIWIEPTTGNKTCTFPDPTNALNLHRKIKVKNVGDGTYKVTLNPNAAETFNVMSGNEEWTLSSFELLQSGDWAEFMCDGTNWIKCNEPYWHYFDDPATGEKGTKTSGWTADSFTSGLEITYDEAPIGSLAVRAGAIQYTTKSNVYWRKSGDANISNTPNASNEKAHRLLTAVEGTAIFTLWLSSDLKVQIAVSDTATDFDYYAPEAYLQ